MTNRQATWLFANGGGVVYHNHLYQIRKVNSDKRTCLLVSLPYEYLVINVPLDEITAETEYDWNKAIIEPIGDDYDD